MTLAVSGKTVVEAQAVAEQFLAAGDGGMPSGSETASATWRHWLACESFRAG